MRTSLRSFLFSSRFWKLWGWLDQWCRYIKGPAIANERLKLNSARDVVLERKTPCREGTTHLVMSPLEFIQRLAALVPGPRLNLICLHGLWHPASDREYCLQCGGALKRIAPIEAPEVIATILTHLGLPVRAPPRSTKPRDSTPIPDSSRFSLGTDNTPYPSHP